MVSQKNEVYVGRKVTCLCVWQNWEVVGLRAKSWTVYCQKNGQTMGHLEFHWPWKLCCSSGTSSHFYTFLWLNNYFILFETGLNQGGPFFSIFSMAIDHGIDLLYRSQEKQVHPGSRCRVLRFACTPPGTRHVTCERVKLIILLVRIIMTMINRVSMMVMMMIMMMMMMMMTMTMTMIIIIIIIIINDNIDGSKTMIVMML